MSGLRVFFAELDGADETVRSVISELADRVTRETREVAVVVAGRAIAPAQGGQAGAGAGAAGSGGGEAGSGALTGSGAQQQGPRVTVNVWGHIIGVSGIHEVAAVLNDAVLNKDVELTATNTKTGAQVTR